MKPTKKYIEVYTKSKHVQAFYDAKLGDDRRPTNKDQSRVKVIVSGNIVEVFEYQNPVLVGSKKNGDIKPYSPDTHYVTEDGVIYANGYDPEIARQNNCRKSKNMFRRLILSNFDNRAIFITLTFRDGVVNDVTSVSECNKELKKFIQRLRRQYDDFKYASVIEFQDTNGRGAVHYHLIMDIPYVPYDQLADLWGNGFIGVNRITHVDNIGAYVTKYMTKDTNDPRLRGEKAYTSSKNLIRPVVLQQWDALEVIKDHLQNKKEVYRSCYESEYQGEITYKEYNLQRE